MKRIAGMLAMLVLVVGCSDATEGNDDADSHTSAAVTAQDASPIGWTGWQRRDRSVELVPTWTSPPGGLEPGKRYFVVVSAGSCKAGVAAIDPLMSADEDPVCAASLAVTFRDKDGNVIRRLPIGGSGKVSTQRPRVKTSAFLVPINARGVSLSLSMVGQGYPLTAREPDEVELPLKGTASSSDSDGTDAKPE